MAPNRAQRLWARLFWSGRCERIRRCSPARDPWKVRALCDDAESGNEFMCHLWFLIRHEIFVPTFTPVATSNFNHFLSWLLGRLPEYVDPRFISKSDGRGGIWNS